ncbi:hypothetical protein Slin15195_G033040 [Septoria linicola]|uniref:Zn(2)-C6 fungal-type domain-containing protein n=1 Tax=Septoria linicola TaxID=215465 RepID=A0A9Q9AJ42_9PEZI|nr:hypothetical protein Slin14017_G032060 [Septoria linicola]USW49985.1 hypothetical protein Slin15195_G033040 [Septoria linicola]
MDSKAKQRRSRKVCENCHIRKLRCNVEDTGTPCSNCVNYQASCTIRRRKNRRESVLSDSARRHGLLVVSPTNATFSVDSGIDSVTQASASDVVNKTAGPSGRSPGSILWWDNNTPEASHPNQTAMHSYSYDFGHGIELDDVFTFTANNAPQAPAQGSNSLVAVLQQGTLPTLPIEHLCADDQAFLHSQGCFDLPRPDLFRQLMLLYFKLVHPNLPIVLQNEFWSQWNGDTFELGTYSLFLVRSMIYAASSYADLTLLSALGFASKREARKSCYRQAKLLFDFQAERDPVSNAQACLLLTYETSTMELRINQSWLLHAIRFARMARADSYYRYQNTDSRRAKMLKRIWWSVICRDRTLSLGLRRTLQVDFDPTWEDASSGRLREEYILHAADFDSELGASPVHSLETQLTLVRLSGITCQLMHSLTLALNTLYHHEGLDDRLEAVSRSLVSSINDVYRAIAELRRWHDMAIQIFPSPISLGDGDVDDAISIYGNCLWVYHSSVLFALQTHVIFIHELIPASRSLINSEDSIDDAVAGMEDANGDIMRRIRELIQVRLVDLLPISVTPLVGPPLLLQAINVAAVRGTQMEAIESRKLDIFTRTLESSRKRFHGSDIVTNVLSNLIAYAQDDETFMSAMTNWRQGSDDSNANTTSQRRIKLDWSNLVCKNPKLFLRLMAQVDLAFCTGRPPEETDFPDGLQRHTP